MFITEEHSVKKKIGFILTKWYVNVIAASSSAVNGSCFILTKWYVNRLFLSMMIQSTRVLY